MGGGIDHCYGVRSKEADLYLLHWEALCVVAREEWSDGESLVGCGMGVGSHNEA